MLNSIPEVIQVTPYSNRTVKVVFADGKTIVYDTSHLKGNIYKQLDDESFFQNRCMILNGTLAWDISGKKDPSDCIDIDPYTIYNYPHNRF